MALHHAIASRTHKYYKKYCNILGLMEDGETPDRPWDGYANDVMPLYNIKFRYIFISKNHANPSFKKIQVGTRVTGEGHYPLSLKDLLKPPSAIKELLNTNQEIQDVFIRAENLAENFSQIKHRLSGNFSSKSQLQAFLCLHYFEPLCQTIECESRSECPVCKKITYQGNTTIGIADETIHGDLDMICHGLRSGCATAVTVTLVGEGMYSDSSPGSRSICEVKLHSASQDESQVSMQNVVFGITESNRRDPEKEGIIKPIPKTILVDREHFIVYFYAADKDLFLRSLKYRLDDEWSIYLLAILFNFHLFYRQPQTSMCYKSGFQKIMKRKGLFDAYDKLENFDTKRKGKHEILSGEFQKKRRVSVPSNSDSKRRKIEESKGKINDLDDGEISDEFC